MIFPLEELVKFKGSIYEITAAASRRAFQLAKIKDPICYGAYNSQILCFDNYGTNQEIKHFHLHIMPNFLKENGTKSIDEVYDILKGKF